jgi:ABC-type nitrate/sulfonate/bicarbonate transport system substrate-binding protein
MPMMQTRGRFLTTLSLAGAASLLRVPPALAAEEALETTAVRLPKVLGVCVSPQYVAEELLRAEGFTDIVYVETPAAAVPKAIAHGRLDFGLNYAPLIIPAIDAAEPVTILSGVHVGCFELSISMSQNSAMPHIILPMPSIIQISAPHTVLRNRQVCPRGRFAGGDIGFPCIRLMAASHHA